MAHFRPKAWLAVPLAATLAFSYAAAPVALAAAADIQLSEVVTNGDDADWVELYNSSDADIDIAGWTAIDGGKNSTAITFPADTIVPAKGYYVFSTDKNTPDGSDGFGLGKDDKIKISDASGKQVDSYSWTEHPRILDGVNTSWIRVGDDWQVSLRSTKGAGNEQLRVVINEVVSDGAESDWVELANPTGKDVALDGWTAVDDDKTHTPITIPAGTTIPAGGYYVFDTEKGHTPDGSKGFGLGNGDEVEIKDATGHTVDLFKYTEHAKLNDVNTSWGRLPDMYGEFAVTGEPTRGEANAAPEPAPTDPNPAEPAPLDPATAVKIESDVVINEVESNGDAVGDWVELYNKGTKPVDISGWRVLDNDDKHAPLVIPDGTTIQPGGFYRFYTEGAQVLGQQKGFGLGGDDSVRLYTTKNELADSVSWNAHAAETWGRLPDGTGNFADTAATPEAANKKYEAPKPLEAQPWPVKGLTIKSYDLGSDFNVEDMSGVDFDADGNAWVVNNGEGGLWKLTYDEAKDQYSIAGHWRLRYTDGTGTPDAEGVTVGPDGALYVATERDNDNKNVSRPSVLRFAQPAQVGGELNAADEWNLSEHTGAIGANSGAEAISYIPERDLYAVGVEANGEVLFLQLGANGASTLVQRYKSPFAGVMALDYDMKAGELRVLCDEACDGQSILLSYDKDRKEFVEASKVQARPEDMDNFANEGYARYVKEGACVDGKRTVTTRYLWTDDTNTNGVALRGAVATDTVDCTPEQPQPQPQPDASSSIDGKCKAALIGWGATAALLIPAALLQQVGIASLGGASAQARDAFATANAQLQQQLGIFDPQLANQAKQAQEAAAAAAPAAAALILGTAAVASIAHACAR